LLSKTEWRCNNWVCMQGVQCTRVHRYRGSDEPIVCKEGLLESSHTTITIEIGTNGATILSPMNLSRDT